MVLSKRYDFLLPISPHFVSFAYPTTTQDLLPVAGQALLDEVFTRKVPMKGFKVVVYISFPSLKLSWRNRCNRCELGD